MGNRKRVKVEGTCESDDVGALRTALTMAVGIRGGESYIAEPEIAEIPELDEPLTRQDLLKQWKDMPHGLGACREQQPHMQTDC